jgi:eukaryotic-like serine/threonine-protein kinase
MDSPRQIGRYRVLRRLGRGGMAEVYLGLAFGASGFERRVALKRLLPSFRGVAEYERLLIEEARLGALLDFRNLVRVHDLGVDGGSYFACMDWVDGADLETLARAGPPPTELALLVGEEVSLALEYVHAATDGAGRPLGLVHRDVSPSNILVSRAGEVKLADFGIAKATLLADRTLAGVRKGKYAYMSPEQVAREPLTNRSDQFGLGIVLAELLTGRRPFDGDSVLETLERIRAAEAPDLGGIAPDLAAIVGRCLARDPRERYRDASSLRRALAAAGRRYPEASAPDLGAWVALRAPAPGGD